jgi:hypothetical protein
MIRKTFLLVVIGLSACVTTDPCHAPWERRSFDDLEPIVVSSSGMAWNVVPKTYARPTGEGNSTHWISLTLKPAGSEAGETFFDFQYGDDVATYWVYALRVCDLNADGRDDLMFYAGDDTSDVRVEFTNTGSTLAETKRSTTQDE